MNREPNKKRPVSQPVDAERRTHPRFNVDLPIRYYQADSLISRNGRAMNVSEEGILIYLPDQVKTGQTMKLKLSFFSDFDWDSIEAVSEVVWSDLHLWEAWGDYRSGMKFIDMAAKDNVKLKNYLKSISC
jgi:hypothetical protein